MIKIRVQNFQSVEDQTLEVNGFTAITGPNNVGKTAFLRAVRGVFSNTKGDWFVRHGTDFATVEVTFEDGTSVTWQKGKGRNRYRINDSDWFKKVGSGVPEEIADVLGISPVVAGTTTLTPNYNVAGDNVFLLNDPGSVLAEAISDVERVGLLNRALKKAESGKRKATSTLKVRESDRKVTREHLEEFDGLSSLGSRIELVSLARGKAEKMRKAYTTLEGYRQDMEKVTQICDALSGVESVGDVPDETVERALKARRAIESMSSFLRDLGRAETSIQEVESQLPLYTGVDTISGVLEEKALLREIRQLHSELADVESKISTGRERLAMFPELQDVQLPDNTELKGLLSLREQMDAAGREVDKASANLRASEVELGEVEEFLSDNLSHIGTCPLCGGGV